MSILGGYISVFNAIIGKKRKLLNVFYDKERFDKVFSSKYHLSEKKQYAELKKICEKYHIRPIYKNKEFFENISSSCGGIAAEFSEREFTDIIDLLNKPSPYLVYLEGIEDPFNFGYVIRSLYLSGCDGVILPKRNFFTSDDIVVRSSAGTSELLDISLCDDISEYYDTIKNNNIRIICTGKEGSISMYDADLKKPLLLVIGGERRCISKTFSQFADCVIEIPYGRNSNISLSASSASSILAFEVFRNNQG